MNAKEAREYLFSTSGLNLNPLPISQQQTIFKVLSPDVTQAEIDDALHVAEVGLWVQRKMWREDAPFRMIDAFVHAITAK